MRWLELLCYSASPSAILLMRLSVLLILRLLVVLPPLPLILLPLNISPTLSPPLFLFSTFILVVQCYRLPLTPFVGNHVECEKFYLLRFAVEFNESHCWFDTSQMLRILPNHWKRNWDGEIDGDKDRERTQDRRGKGRMERKEEFTERSKRCQNNDEIRWRETKPCMKKTIEESSKLLLKQMSTSSNQSSFIRSSSSLFTSVTAPPVPTPLLKWQALDWQEESHLLLAHRHLSHVPKEQRQQCSLCFAGGWYEEGEGGRLFVCDSYVSIADRILSYVAAPISTRSNMFTDCLVLRELGILISYTIFLIVWCVIIQTVSWSGQEAVTLSVLMSNILSFSLPLIFWTQVILFEWLMSTWTNPHYSARTSMKIITHFHILSPWDFQVAEFDKFMAPHEHHWSMPTWWALDFASSFSICILCSLFWLRTLDEAIQAANALELSAPRNAASMPARFDVCGGVALPFFSNLNLDTLKQTIQGQASFKNCWPASESVRTVSFLCVLFRSNL